MTADPRPLSGVRVLELGQLLAGPFCGTILAYFGAEVVKVEPPGGDPIRGWRLVGEDGTSPWWKSLARNKRSVTLDLRTDEGRAIARRLAARCDVLVENFRPGTLERWGLGPDVLWQDNADLVIARVSGYGQTGPYSPRLGYAAVCEGVGGFRALNGVPGETPVRPNLSLGDSLSGLHAALGVLLALRARDRGAGGQIVDVALYESVFNMIEAVVPEYFELGAVRGPSGSTVTGIAPSGTYRCRDDKHVVIGANGESVFRRFARAIGRPELADDARFADNRARVRHQAELEAVITSWTESLDAADVVRRLEEAEVPAGLLYTVKDMANDAHFRARGLFEEVAHAGASYVVPAILPKLERTPGRTDWIGPRAGEHNREVLGKWLDLSEDELARLAQQGVI